MATQAQIDANRRNAQKSTGPKTDEGKEISRMNALIHGLRAQCILLPGEDPEEFEAFARLMRMELEFRGPSLHETLRVERLIHLEWKLRRIPRLEQIAVARLLAPQTQGAADPCERLLDSLLGDDGQGVMERLQRYEMRLGREIRACRRELDRSRRTFNHRDVHQSYCDGYNRGVHEQAEGMRASPLPPMVHEDPEPDPEFGHAEDDELQASDPPAAEPGSPESAERTQFGPKEPADNALPAEDTVAGEAEAAPYPLPGIPERGKERVA